MGIVDRLRETIQSNEILLGRFFSRKVFFIIFGLIFISILIFLLFYFIGENCGNDADCFDENVASCDRSKVKLVRDNAVYSYNIKGSALRNFNYCVMDVKLEEYLANDFEAISLVEGKSMKCHIPKNNFNTLNGTTNLIKYCTGPLKEASYELTINRLYGIVVKNLGRAVIDLGEFL